ncbi:MAG TPA: glycosyltransferase family 39 protein [Acidimicrobiales bacterium]|nr:glycosyltransferase family 39 protein [Acidimicrobiales bacterium]
MAAAVPGRRWPWEPVALALILGAFTAAVVSVLRVRSAFEYDEAVYAVRARGWVQHTPLSGWDPHRGPALSALGTVALWFGNGDNALRIVGLLSGLAAVAACWWLGRSVYGPVTAVVGAAAFATSAELQARSGQFLTDVPAAAVLLAAMAVLWWQLETRSEPDRRLLLVAPLVAFAFYLRYGSVLPIGAIALVGGLLWWHRLRRRPRWPLATAGLLAVLLVPHAVYAWRLCGTPWGVVSFTSRFAASHRTGIGDALFDYVHGLPSRLFGRMAGTLMLAGLAFAVVTAWRSRRGGRPDPAWRGAVFLAVPATIQIVALGMSEPAQARFLLLPVALLTIAGARAAVCVAEALPRPGRQAAAAGAVVLLAMALQSGSARALTQTRQSGSWREVIRATGRAMRARAGGPCAAVSVGVPMMSWYSHCAVTPYGVVPAAGGTRFLVAVDRYRVRVSPEVAAPYDLAADPTPLAVVRPGTGSKGSAVVRRLTGDVRAPFLRPASVVGPDTCDLPDSAVKEK